MMGTFRLHITLGNAAMETPDDVADALRQVADRLEGEPTIKGVPSLIRDLNGNTVGRFVYALGDEEVE